MSPRNITILLVFALTLAACQNTSTPDEWHELFNGKDLSGWKASENKGTFTVKDGMIVAQGDRSHLFYMGPEEEPFDVKNFELSVDVMTLPRANSGIFFHTAYQEEGWPSNGYEVQVNNSHIGGGDYREFKKTASLYGVRNTYKAFAKDSTWFNMNIRVEGRHIRVTLDGKLIVDHIESSASARSPHGTIALQGHDPGSTVMYKNIKMRILDDKTTDSASIKEDRYPQVLAKQKENFAFIDTYVKANDSLRIEAIIDEFYKSGINVGVVASGPDNISGFINAYKAYPVFLGIRINDEGGIPAEVRKQVDYTIGEISTFTDNAGKTININEAAPIVNPEAFMNSYVDAIVSRLNSGSLNIWASATLLPTSLQGDYNKLWTNQRMLKVIDAAKLNNVAIEVNNTLKMPSIEFLKLAKARGCRFANGGIFNRNTATLPEYFIQAIDSCQLTYKDVYIPGWENLNP